MSRARDMANLGAQAGSGLDASDITTGTLGNTVQDNITRLGTVTTGTFNSTLGTSATVPASIGGGEVLLDTHTANNDSATLEVDLTQYTTFETYRIRFVGWVPASDDKNFYMKVGTASNSINTSYRTAGNTAYYNGSTSNHSYVTTAGRLLQANGVGGDFDYEGMFLDGFVYQPRDSTKRTRASAQINFYDASHNTRVYNMSGMATPQQDDAVWQFTWESSVNTSTGKFYLYGIKNA